MHAAHAIARAPARLVLAWLVALAALLAGYGPVERHFAISAIDGAGCRELTFAIMAHIEDQKRAAEAAVPSEAQDDETED